MLILETFGGNWPKGITESKLQIVWRGWNRRVIEGTVKGNEVLLRRESSMRRRGFWGGGGEVFIRRIKTRLRKMETSINPESVEEETVCRSRGNGLLKVMSLEAEAVGVGERVGLTVAFVLFERRRLRLSVWNQGVTAFSSGGGVASGKSKS